MGRFSIFTVISGAGWLLDVALTFLLVQLGSAIFFASVTGSVMAVSFVFVASRIMVFEARRGTRAAFGDYAPYLMWHAITIPLWSFLVAAIALAVTGVAAWALGLPGDWLPLPTPEALAAAFAKATITPATLTANFFFTRWLVERHRHV